MRLKPCPFCGGKARVMQMGYPHWIYCEKCGAKIHAGTTDEKDSIMAWNKRAEDEPVIHCRDCKWFGEPGCAIWIVDDSDKPTEDDFCSFADPKDLNWVNRNRKALAKLRENKDIEAMRKDLLKRMKKLEEKDND